MLTLNTNYRRGENVLFIHRNMLHRGTVKKVWAETNDGGQWMVEYSVEGKDEDGYPAFFRIDEDSLMHENDVSERDRHFLIQTPLPETPNGHS